MIKINTIWLLIMFIFLDESGDLGFDWTRLKTSKYFVITLLVCNNIKTKNFFNFAIRRTLKKLNHKKKKHLTLELKGTETTLSIKNFFFNQLVLQDWLIYSVILDKRNFNTRSFKSSSGKSNLYNNLAQLIIKEIELDKTITDIDLVVDRCKNPKEIKIFNECIEGAIRKSLPIKARLHIHHETSHENPCLQAIDLFCWGILRKYQHQESDWYNMFKDKIAREIVF